MVRKPRRSLHCPDYKDVVCYSRVNDCLNLNHFREPNDFDSGPTSREKVGPESLSPGGTACAHTAGDPALVADPPQEVGPAFLTVRSRARRDRAPGPDPRYGIDWNHPDLPVSDPAGLRAS